MARKRASDIDLNGNKINNDSGTGDVVVKLGDAVGADEFVIQDSSNAEMFRVNSNGLITKIVAPETVAVSGDLFLFRDATNGQVKGIDFDNMPGGGISNVSEDTTPELGGNLDILTHAIVGSSTGDVRVRLGDGAGADSFNVENSSSGIVFQIKSNGDLATTNNVDMVFDSGKHVIAQLGDALGADEFQIQDSGSIPVFSINSDGDITMNAVGTFLDLDDGYITDTNESDVRLRIDGTGDTVGVLIQNSTPVTVFEIDGLGQLKGSLNGDVVVKLGDLAGVDEFKVNDSAGVTQFYVNSNGTIGPNSAGNVYVELGDTAGADKFAVLDSSAVLQFGVDSNGTITDINAVPSTPVTGDKILYRDAGDFSVKSFEYDDIAAKTDVIDRYVWSYDSYDKDATVIKQKVSSPGTISAVRIIANTAPTGAEAWVIHKNGTTISQTVTLATTATEQDDTSVGSTAVVAGDDISLDPTSTPSTASTWGSIIVEVTRT